VFVIPCKYNNNFNFIVDLCKDIRSYHSNEEIVVIDSGSDNKDYFKLIESYNVIIEDINNKNWMIGAYWYAFKKYDRNFYYFLHDSMKVKGSLDSFKEKDLTIMCYFDRGYGDNFNGFENKINELTKYTYLRGGLGVYGPIFFCKRNVMKLLQDMEADKILPNNKQETGWCEGSYGFFFEHHGFNLKECSLYGNVLENEQPNGKSGVYPFNTSWQYPIEKFYASHVDLNRR
jgi:hypothetical protein